jgi:hypothetical protein
MFKGAHSGQFCRTPIADTRFCHGICGRTGVWASTGHVPTYPSSQSPLCALEARKEDALGHARQSIDRILSDERLTTKYRNRCTAGQPLLVIAPAPGVRRGYYVCSIRPRSTIIGSKRLVSAALNRAGPIHGLSRHLTQRSGAGAS